MERSKALTLLGLDDSSSLEGVTDALDQAVFQLRDYFLRGPILPQLANSRVEKCVQLSDAAQSLGVSPLGEPVDLPDLVNQNDSFEALILGHVENLRRCRNSLAKTLDPDSVAQLGHLMSQVQVEYMRSFLDLTDTMADLPAAQHVPAKEETDWMAILAAIRAATNSPGHGLLLQEMVSKERARMSTLLKTNQPAQH